MNKFLAVFSITVLWFVMVVLATAIANLFNGNYFVLRFILIYPFVHGSISSSIQIWKYYTD